MSATVVIREPGTFAASDYVREHSQILKLARYFQIGCYDDDATSRNVRGALIVEKERS